MSAVLQYGIEPEEKVILASRIPLEKTILKSQ
jgi:hypothetical protein